MSAEATAIMGAILGFYASLLVVLAFVLAKVYVRLAQIEQRLLDKLNGGHRELR